MAGRQPDFPGVQRQPQILPNPGLAKTMYHFAKFLFPLNSNNLDFHKDVIIFKVISGSDWNRTENRRNYGDY